MNRLILGAFKSSPVTFLTHDTNMIPFKNLAVRQHHNFIYKRLTAATNHPTRRILQQELSGTPTRHPSTIHKLLRRTDMTSHADNILETIYPYPEPPWMEPRWIVENVGYTREEVKEKKVTG